MTPGCCRHRPGRVEGNHSVFQGKGAEYYGLQVLRSPHVVWTTVKAGFGMSGLTGDLDLLYAQRPAGQTAGARLLFLATEAETQYPVNNIAQ